MEIYPNSLHMGGRGYVRAKTEFGHRFFIPRNPIAELEYMYGKDWMIPLKSGKDNGWIWDKKPQAKTYREIFGVKKIKELGVDVELLKEKLPYCSCTKNKGESTPVHWDDGEL